MLHSLIGFIGWLVEWKGCETVAHTERQAPHDETPVALRSLAECELAIMQTIARHRDALGRDCDGSWATSSGCRSIACLIHEQGQRERVQHKEHWTIVTLWRTCCSVDLTMIRSSWFRILAVVDNH